MVANQTPLRFQVQDITFAARHCMGAFKKISSTAKTQDDRFFRLDTIDDWSPSLGQEMEISLLCEVFELFARGGSMHHPQAFIVSM